MDLDGYDVENVLDDKPKKKKNSKNKGKRGELLLVNQFNNRFDTQTFSRVVGSGNRWSHVAYAKKDYIGDIVCPDNFRFIVECKFGYPEIELIKALDDGQSLLDDFFKQADDDSKRVSKDPLLCWKKDRRPTTAFVKTNILPKNRPWCHEIRYKDWIGVTLTNLFLLPDKFFFE